MLVVALAYIGLSGCGAGHGGGGRKEALPDSGPGPARDADSDGISDYWEGRDEAVGAVDTDGDGVSDYLDGDSDDDGIRDAVEGGVSGDGEPRDTDADGVYDFRDADSDGNGIADSLEGELDDDGDGEPSYRDLDNDGDALPDVLEIGDDPASPIDADGDGIPDYADRDSDGDTIGDVHEAVPEDTDGDEIPDRHDLDSDGDGWTDADEAGDDNIETAPVDTDSDSAPDFRDADSDNDGLSDADELERGTGRTATDTDGDGVSDLVEVLGCAAGDLSCAGDALDPIASPRTRGDFVFLAPYMGAPDPMRDTLSFATDLRLADVYFLIDTTGSMSGAIRNVRSSLSSAGGIIERVRASIPDTLFGVGDFKDYPVGGYGGSSDYAFRHRQDISVDPAASQAAVNTLSASGGSDLPESQVPALWAMSTGMALAGRSGATTARTGCLAGTFGYPCFREGAVPIVVLITDASFHSGPGMSQAYSDGTVGGHAPTYDEAVAALVAANIRVIGIAVGSSGRANLEAVATATGAVDAAGAPLVSVASSGTVSDALVTQIQTLANQTPIDISVVYEDDASDAVDTLAAFVDYIEANVAGDATRGCVAHAAEDTDGDGHPDTFRGVTPGTPVCFDIVPKQNDTVEPAAAPRFFRATLHVMGDGYTELDARDIFFLVPPDVEGPDGPD